VIRFGVGLVWCTEMMGRKWDGNGMVIKGKEGYRNMWG